MKGLDEKVLKIAIAQAAVSSHLLEYQLHPILARVANIKSQAAKHEITIRFLEPSGFENIALDANVWKKFMNDQVGPSYLCYFKRLINHVICCIYLFLSIYARGQNFVEERLGEAQRAKRVVQDFCCLYKYRCVRCKKRPFFMLSLCNVIVIRTTSSYNKEFIFSAGECIVKFEMLPIDWLNVNYFCFNYFYEL